MQRQYSGTAGRIENSQIGVFLAYASPRGHAFVDRELYLPREWAEHKARRREAGVPAGVAFQTKPQLARTMLERALTHDLVARWVTADEVYGNDRALRLWLEQRRIPYLLACKRTERVWVLTRRGLAQMAVATLAAQVPAPQWQRLSAGDGVKGPRVYKWARVPLRPVGEPGTGYWLLLRRSLMQPTDVAYHVCCGPAATPLRELVRVAGAQWTIEDAFEAAKGEVGLDQYEVRRWTGWYRHITLALLAHAYLTMVRAQTRTDSGEKGGRGREHQGRARR